MDPQSNPYEPPKSEINTDTTVALRKMKRPASHKWAIFFYAFFLMGVSYGFRDIAQLPERWVVVLAAVICFFMFALPMLGLLFLRQSRATNYITSVSLALLILRFGFTAITRLSPQGAGVTFSAIMFWVFVCVVLWWKFTLGNPSRAYFGFCELKRPIDPGRDALAKPRPGGISGQKRPDGWDVNY